MKIKDITISIFAIIGFVTILSSFNNQSQETHYTVPESHEWEMHLAISDYFNFVYSINKKTGEVRKHSTGMSHIKEDSKDKTKWVKNPLAGSYIVSKEK